MITQEINATINSYDFSGQIIVPSAVITSTPQEEELNLTYAPNFKIEINDSYAYLKNEDDVQVEFNFGYNTCTAYATVINRSNDVVTLQYNYGLEVEEGGGDDPEPEPTVDPVLSQSINNILGSNYDVINDMSDEDALAAANNILYGDEEPPK